MWCQVPSGEPMQSIIRPFAESAMQLEIESETCEYGNVYGSLCAVQFAQFLETTALFYFKRTPP